MDKEALDYFERSAVLFTCSGSNAVVKKWCENGFRESTSDVAEALRRSIPEILAKYLL